MRQHRIAAILCAAVLVLAAPGCGGDGDGGSGSSKQHVTVAVLPVVDAAALYIAQEQGYFAAEDLEVTLQPVAQSLAALPALKNGQLEVINGNYVTFLQAHQQGTLAMRIVADGAAVAPEFLQVLVPPGSPIKTVKDLAGKTVAVNILNNIQSLTLNAVLRANGVDPATIKYRAVQFSVMDKALAGGDVDAVHTAEPFGTVLKQKVQATQLLDAGQAPVTDLPVSGYISTADWVDKNPDTAAAFQRAITRAQNLANSDRKQVEKVLPSFAKVDAPTAAALDLPAYPSELEPARLQKLIDLMRQQGLLKADLDAASIIYHAGR
ncbi:ABC transporter substrate-binding protein [Symbioplanes lichenis]|uniref:ABC transporter substrate-binding protein n=1 Tax=Symbioplanes lichenis TaxID=1629072 RepID=UPI002739C2BC|nr:ABC transporter substrate-binding protein [Actinoplanes lichenis]